MAESASGHHLVGRALADRRSGFVCDRRQAHLLFPSERRSLMLLYIYFATLYSQPWPCLSVWPEVTSSVSSPHDGQTAPRK